MWMMLNIASLILTNCVVQCFEEDDRSFDCFSQCSYANDHNVQEKFSKDVLQQYPGLFITVDELQLQLNMSEKKRKKALFEIGIDTDLQKYLPGDGDQCCPTNVDYDTPYCYKNIRGGIKCIVQGIEDRYQFIPEAKCINDYGNCPGFCFLEKSVVTLLAWKETVTRQGLPVEFDFFEVPTYCSCKNTQMRKNEL